MTLWMLRVPLSFYLIIILMQSSMIELVMYKDIRVYTGKIGKEKARCRVN